MLLSVGLYIELAYFIRPSVRAGKIDELSSDVQELSCRPKASSSSTTRFDKKYYLCLKMLSCICSHTIKTTANYYLLLWERREIVPGILGEKPHFSASGWGCCVSWVGLYCSAAGAAEDPFRKPLLAKCSANTSFIWNVTYTVENLRQVLDFKSVNWTIACLSSLGLGGWSQEEE